MIRRVVLVPNRERANALEVARAAAEREGKQGWEFSLHFPSYYPLLQFADKRELRETIYRANATKASELGAKPEWDNTQNIIDILKLRDEEAKLLGYDNFAEVSLVPKMATSPKQVIQFLEDHGALSPSQREMVIDRLCELPDDDINVGSAKLVALMVLWAQKAELPILLGEELLDAIHGEPTMQ